MCLECDTGAVAMSAPIAAQSRYGISSVLFLRPILKSREPTADIAGMENNVNVNENSPALKVTCAQCGADKGETCLMDYRDQRTMHATRLAMAGKSLRPLRLVEVTL